MPAGLLKGGVACLGLMRDAVEGTGAGASSAAELSDPVSGPEDSRRLFLDMLSPMASYDGGLLPEKTSEASLSELEEVCEEAAFRRISGGMAARSDVRSPQIELKIKDLSERLFRSLDRRQGLKRGHQTI